MTRTTIKQTLIDSGVTEVSGALLDWLTASGNDVLREALEEAKRRASLIAIVEQGCGGTLSFKEMANSAMLQGRELAEFIDTALSTTPTMSAEDMREAAAKECESYVTPWGRAGSAPDACEGAALECAKRIRSLPLTKEPTP